MSRMPPLWIQAGDYAASTDRALIGALYPAARCDGCAVSIAGTGDMGLSIQPGMVAVPTSNATGSTLCYSNGVETVVLDPAPAPGSDRIDLVVCSPTGADLGGGADEFIFTKVTGTPGAPPVTPPLPAGMVCLAQVTVIGGSVTVDPARIFDTRPSTLAVPGPAAPPPPQTKYGYAIPYGATGSPNPAHPVKTLSGRAQQTTDAAGRTTLSLTNNWTSAGVNPKPTVLVAFHGMAQSPSLQVTTDTGYPWSGVDAVPLRLFSVTGAAWQGTFNLIYTVYFQNGAT